MLVSHLASYLNCRKKQKQVRNADQKCAGTNVAGTRLGQRCPLLGHRQKREGGAGQLPMPARGSPFGDEVYKLWRESVGGQLRGWLVHYLLELLERRAPRLVGELQNGQLDLGDKDGECQSHIRRTHAIANGSPL